MDFVVMDKTADEEYDLPSYSTPGRIFVELLSIDPNKHRDRYELEILDYDLDTSVFWIQEGGFMDYWVGDHCSFEHPGYYVIEGITGAYIKGDGWMTDDDERWEYERVRKATVDEIMFGVLDG